MDNYQEKYLKYKKKYLRLKLNGEADGSTITGGSAVLTALFKQKVTQPINKIELQDDKEFLEQARVFFSNQVDYWMAKKEKATLHKNATLEHNNDPTNINKPTKIVDIEKQMCVIMGIESNEYTNLMGRLVKYEKNPIGTTRNAMFTLNKINILIYTVAINDNTIGSSCLTNEWTLRYDTKQYKEYTNFINSDSYISTSLASPSFVVFKAKPNWKAHFHRDSPEYDNVNGITVMTFIDNYIKLLMTSKQHITDRIIQLANTEAQPPQMHYGVESTVHPQLVVTAIVVTPNSTADGIVKGRLVDSKQLATKAIVTSPKI
jgi:hypothetical protein